MSVNIVVRGLPGEMTFPKLLNSFRMLLKKIYIKQFWIRDLSDMDGHFKQMTVELTNNSDARRARNYLNNMPFEYKMMEYPMEVYLDEESTHLVNEDDYEFRGRKKNRGRKRIRARSRSPVYSQEASKLDMEIELLRKQRQVIEEERRLLMEQKKLEMIREYGPSASREFDDFEDFEPPRKRRQPEPVPKRPRQKSPPLPKIPKIPKSTPQGLPLFFRPCKSLISEMKPIIEKDTTSEEVEILIKLIRAAIRKDLALALEDKAYMKHGEIVKLYRKRHPKEEDESFVAKILANIRASYLTTGETGKKIKKEEKITEDKTDDTIDKVIKEEKVTDNKTDDTNDKEKEGGGDKVVNDDKEPKDIPENGENETDAAVPDTSAVTELNKTQELENPVENSSEEALPETKTNDSATVDNTTVVDEIEKENELLDEGEPKAADWVEQWSPQKNNEVAEDTKVES